MGSKKPWAFVIIWLLGAYWLIGSSDAEETDETQRRKEHELIEGKVAEAAIGGSIGYPAILGFKAIVQDRYGPWGGQVSYGSFSDPEDSAETLSLVRIEARYQTSNEDLRWYPFGGIVFYRESMYVDAGVGIEARALPGGGIGLEGGIAYLTSDDLELPVIVPIVSLNLSFWFAL